MSHYNDEYKSTVRNYRFYVVRGNVCIRWVCDFMLHGIDCKFEDWLEGIHEF